MRFIIQVVLTSFLSYMLQHIMPPWVVTPVAAVVIFLTPTTPLSAFWGGFVGVSVLWMIKATMIDVYTKSILSLKIAPLLGMKSSIMLILLTGLIGGILGGLGAASGQQLLRISKRKRTDVYKAQ